MSAVRRLTAAAACVVAVSGLAGCGLGNGLYNVPLPGGANLGSHPYTITAEFTDVLDLVPQSEVQVNDVAVGRVTKISLEPNGRIADVSAEVNGDVQLPANAVASVQQTSLLGEKYVALAPPLHTAPRGRLKNGARIAVSHTSDGVEVEEVLGALSLVLNGGGIGQLHEIAQELNNAGRGRESGIRTFFRSSRKVVGQLDRRRHSITRTLDALGRLSGALRSQNRQISNVLDTITPGIRVLANQQGQLNSLLHAFNKLSSVTVSTLNASSDDIVGDLRSLSPILSNLAAAGTALPRSLQVLLTYPFTDGAVDGIQGDYLNSYVTTAFATRGGTVISPLVSTGRSTHRTAAGTSAWPRSGSSRSRGTTDVGPPPGLLPSTSSAAAGLPSSLTVSTGHAAGGH